MAEKSETIVEFINITAASAEQAEHLLGATDWNLDAAVQLFFENIQANDAHLDDKSEALVRQLMQEDAAVGQEASAGPGPTTTTAAAAVDEEGIRRPDEARVEQLFDSSAHMHIARRSRASANAGPSTWRTMSNDANESEEGIDGMYKPPLDLMTDLTLDELKHVAEQNDQWILINLQDLNVFQSLQLNADLWSSELVKQIVRGSFQFAQRQLPSNDALQLQTTYNLYNLPAVIIVDPNTAQKMFEWSGMLDVQRFMEDIVPFLDTKPSDPTAGSLVKQTHIAGPMPSVATGAAGVAGVSDEDETLTQAIAASLTEHDPSGVMPAGLTPVDLTGAGEIGRAARAGASGSGAMDDDGGQQDPELLQAMAESLKAMSNEQSGEDLGNGDEGLDMAGASEGDVAVAGPNGAELKAAAAARLPPPPAAGTALGRVAIQLPQKRAMLQFVASDTVQTLFDLATTSLSDEEAAQPFELVAASGGQVLNDPSASIQALNLSGAMLRLKWK